MRSSFNGTITGGASELPEPAAESVASCAGALEIMPKQATTAAALIWPARKIIFACEAARARSRLPNDSSESFRVSYLGEFPDALLKLTTPGRQAGSSFVQMKRPEWQLRRFRMPRSAPGNSP